jgi:hypothetical protein
MDNDKETGLAPQQDADKGVLNGKFIIPFLVLYEADRNSGFNMTFPEILDKADTLLKNKSDVDLNLAPDVVSPVRKAFALRYFAFRRFNNTEDRRRLCQSVLSGSGRDKLCELILTYPLQVATDVNFGVEFDPVSFEQDVMDLVDSGPATPGL